MLKKPRLGPAICAFGPCVFTFYYIQLPGGEGVLRISSDGSKDFFGFQIFSKIASFQEFSLNHWRFLSNCHFPHFPHFRQNRHFSWGPVGHVIRIFVKLLAIFRQIAIFAMFLTFRQNGHSSSGPLGNIIRILIKPLAKFR